MEERFQVGVITATHGVKGEVKIFPTTDDPARFKKLKHVILDTGREDLVLKIEGVKFANKLVILKFKGLDNIDDVMKFRQKSLYVERKDAVALEADEYFIADLIGVSVYEEDGSFVGELTDVISTGANDVYVVETDKENAEGSKQLMLPAIKQCILSVDIKERRMTVHIMEGLREL